MQLPLDPREDVLIDNRGNAYFDDVFVSLLLACLREPLIVLPAANVHGIGEKPMDRSNTEGLTPAAAVTASVQPFDDLLHTKRTGFAVAV